MKKRWGFLLISALLLVVTIYSALAITPDNFQEVTVKDEKFSNWNGFILNTETTTMNYLQADGETVIVESIVIINNTNGIKSNINFPQINLDFSNPEIPKEIKFFYSSNYVTGENFKGEKDYLWSKWGSLPTSIDTNSISAIKIQFKAGRYDELDFNVTLQGTGFTAKVDPTKNSCSAIVTPGVYTQTQDIGSTTSCIFFLTDDVDYSCEGYNILYSMGGTPGNVGFYTGVNDNITIRNCPSVKQGSYTTRQPAVQYSASSNTYIYNSTFITYGTDSEGVTYSEMGGENIIQNSTFLTWNSTGIEAINTNFFVNYSFLNSSNIDLDDYAIHLRGNSSAIMHNLEVYSDDYAIFDNNTSSPDNELAFYNIHGKINWTGVGFLSNSTVTGNLAFGSNNFEDSTVYIANNVTAINTSALGVGINTSAIITLNSLTSSEISIIYKYGGYTNDQAIISTGENCILDFSCSSVSYAGGMLNFSTTSLSSFSAREAIPPPRRMLLIFQSLPIQTQQARRIYSEMPPFFLIVEMEI